MDQSVLRSQYGPSAAFQAMRLKLCGPSYAVQAKATRVNAVGLNALNKADLRFAEAEVLLSSSCFLDHAF